MVFSNLSNDSYKPIFLKPELAQLDNYQIYSILAVDYPISKTILSSSPSVYGQNGGGGLYSYDNSWYGMKTYEDYTVNVVERDTKFLAVQTYGLDKPTINFVEIAQNCLVKPRNIYNHTIYTQEYIDNANGYLPPTNYTPVIDSTNIQTYLQLISEQPIFDDTSLAQPWYFRDLASSYFFGDVNTGAGAYTYQSLSIHRFLFDNKFISLTAPSYKDLLRGYSLDSRQSAPNCPRIISNLSGDITIKYYRPNPYESHPLVKSIDWRQFRVSIQASKAICLPIIDPVFGTLTIEGDAELVSEVKLKLSQIPLQNDTYKYSDYYYSDNNIPAVWLEWLQIYNSIVLPAKPDDNSPFARKRYLEYQEPILRVLAANNNCWNNDFTQYEDINFNANHPLFQPLGNSQIFNYHFKPQTDGSFGDLIMDSPRLIEIHTALEAWRFAINSLDSNSPRISTLGWLVERTAQILGIRVDDNGKIDETAEKESHLRRHANGNETNNPQEYGINSFGSKGMLVRHLPNQRTADGKTIAGGYRRVHDLPQLLAETHEQANAAMGYQEGTAIEINIEGEKYVFANQLALLTELFATLKQTQTYAKGSFFSSVVGEQSIKEVMAGLGLRTVDKFIEFEVAGKAAKLYYKGISASQSLRRKLSAIATNIAITIGNVQ